VVENREFKKKKKEDFESAIVFGRTLRPKSWITLRPAVATLFYCLTFTYLCHFMQSHSRHLVLPETLWQCIMTCTGREGINCIIISVENQLLTLAVFYFQAFVMRYLLVSTCSLQKTKQHLCFVMEQLLVKIQADRLAIPSLVFVIFPSNSREMRR
jgi:hypothetical protein